MPLNPTPLPGQKRVLWSLMGQVLFNMMGIGIVGPVLPLYARSFGVGAALVGSLITAFGIARILMNLPAGSLAERFGRRPLLILGPLVTCVAALLTGLAGQFEQIVLFRFLQGLGSSAHTTAAMITLADITDSKTRGRAMSLYQGSLLVGQSFGPTVGGFAAEHFGYRAPFFLYAGLALIASLWALAMVPETKGLALAKATAARGKAAQEKVSSWKIIKELLRDPSFVLVSLVTFTIFFTRTGSRSTVLPLFGHDRLGLGPAELGMMLTVAALLNLATINLSGIMSDRWGRKVVIVPACVLSGSALFAFTLSQSYAFFLFSGALLGIGTGMAGPSPAAYVADIAKPGRTGVTMGLYRTISDVGVSVGPILLGGMADQLGYAPALWANAVLFIVVGVIFGLFAQETVKRVTATPANGSAPEARG
jgi:MFS family permease